MILYFTATGNSRYLAEAMAARLQDTTVDVAALIKEGKHPAFDSERPYVFVTPVYAWRIPRVLERWIRSCTFSGSRQAYFVIDCGSEIGAAGHYVAKLAAEVGFDCRGCAEVVMPENYIVMFTPPPAEADAGILAAATATVEALCGRIAVGERLDTVKNTLAGHLRSDLVNPLFYTFYVGAKKFHATDACVGCGRCATVCMLNNITVKDGRPEWGKDCTHCMACISRCPTEAIEYGKHTRGLRRYVCPGESAGKGGE